MVAARPKSRRFCRNGPNKQKRPKKAQNRFHLNCAPQYSSGDCRMRLSASSRSVWWALVRFRRAILCSVFWANLLFWGAIAVQLGSLGPPEKAIVGGMPIDHGNAPQCQKSRSWRWKLPVLRLPFGHSGALFWAYGQIRAAGRDVNSR